MNIQLIVKGELITPYLIAKGVPDRGCQEETGWRKSVNSLICKEVKFSLFFGLKGKLWFGPGKFWYCYQKEKQTEEKLKSNPIVFIDVERYEVFVVLLPKALVSLPTSIATLG